LELTGRVAEFDAHRGRGVIESPDGARYPFHCTRIADGTRAVPVGMRVRYSTAPGPLGCWEAVRITPA
jgi:cold shock CspA family protein